ncbi:MAG: glycosyltransferase [Saprospiraceae bacterium]
MAKFTHYLVTRFNVPAGKWLQDKEGRPTLDDEWMDHRLDLFKKYCVPTVAGQSEKNFEWLIYCDIKTGDSVRQQIENSTHTITNVQLRYVEKMEDLLIDFKHILNSAETPYVISSRLDNDDGLSIDFIKSVQHQFQAMDRCLINFNHGILYDVNRRIMTQIQSGYLNHYGSLIESKKMADQYLTIMGFHHTSPPEDVSVINLSRPCAWLKIIHERNARSGMKGRLVLSKNILECFLLPNNLFKISFLNSAGYLVWRIKKKMNG